VLAGVAQIGLLCSSQRKRRQESSDKSGSLSGDGCCAGMHSQSLDLPPPLSAPQDATPAAPAGIAFGDLEPLRVVGTGQFGLVRLVRHRATGEPFALKVGAWFTDASTKLMLPQRALTKNWSPHNMTHRKLSKCSSAHELPELRLYVQL